MTEQRLLLRVTEAAELAGIGRSKGYELAAGGQWRTVRVGRRLLVVAESLREWVERLARESADAHPTA